MYLHVYNCLLIITEYRLALHAIILMGGAAAYETLMGYFCTIGGCSTPQKQPRENTDHHLPGELEVYMPWYALMVMMVVNGALVAWQPVKVSWASSFHCCAWQCCSANQAACLLIQALFCLAQPPSQLSYLQAALVWPLSHPAALLTSPSW